MTLHEGSRVGLIAEVLGVYDNGNSYYKLRYSLYVVIAITHIREVKASLPLLIYA